MKRFISTLTKLLISMSIPVPTGGLVYMILAPYAYAERGYFALGGEFLLGVVIALFGTIALFINMDKLCAWIARQLIYDDDRI